MVLLGDNPVPFLGRKLPFSLGRSCCFSFREGNFPVGLFQQNPSRCSRNNIQKFLMASNLENKYPINNLPLPPPKKGTLNSEFSTSVSFNINFQLRKSMKFIKFQTNPGSQPTSLWPKHLPHLRVSSMIGVNIMLGLGKTRGLRTRHFARCNDLIWPTKPKWYEILQTKIT